MNRCLAFAVVFLASPVWAAAPAGQPSGLMMMVPWIAILGIFYFLLIRPQQKQARAHQKMLDGIKRGDRILTQGGLYATVHAVKGKVLEIKLTDDLKVLLARSHVAQFVESDPAAVEAVPVAGGASH